MISVLFGEIKFPSKIVELTIRMGYYPSAESESHQFGHSLLTKAEKLQF